MANIHRNTQTLSAQALAILPELRAPSGHTERLFPSGGSDVGVISENTINNLFRRIGYIDKQSQHLDERKRFMADWGALVAALESGDNVIPFRTA